MSSEKKVFATAGEVEALTRRVELLEKWVITMRDLLVKVAEKYGK